MLIWTQAEGWCTRPAGLQAPLAGRQRAMRDARAHVRAGAGVGGQHAACALRPGYVRRGDGALLQSAGMEQQDCQTCFSGCWIFGNFEILFNKSGKPLRVVE